MTAPWTVWKSRLTIASTVKLPIPGMEKMRSTMTVAPISAPRLTPAIVISEEHRRRQDVSYEQSSFGDPLRTGDGDEVGTHRRGDVGA